MSMPEKYQRSPLRYRRFGGGYRREDVEFALAELRLTMRQLDNDLESLRDRNRDLDAELSAAKAEIETLRAREYELSQTVSAALRRAAEIEDGANARAREIVDEAEEAATRIRTEASRRMEDTKTHMDELLRRKDELIRAMRFFVGNFSEAITMVERGEEIPVDVPGPPAEPAAEEPAETETVAAATPAEEPAVEPVHEQPAELVLSEQQVEAVAAPPDEPQVAPLSPAPVEPAGQTPVPPPQPEQAETPAAPAPPPAERAAQELSVFDTHVELDAGPFSDFAALSAFERSLARLPGVEDVYVRRLADDRALIELTLAEPTPLLRTMQDLLPYALEVRAAESSRIVLDVSAAATAGAR